MTSPPTLLAPYLSLPLGTVFLNHRLCFISEEATLDNCVDFDRLRYLWLCFKAKVWSYRQREGLIHVLHSRKL